MKWNASWGLGAAAIAVALSVSCGEGTNTNTGESEVADGDTALSEAALSVPVIGTFLADCSEAGTAVVTEFVQTNPLNPITGDEITLADALVDDNNALTLPILAGFAEEGPLSADAVAAAFPGGIPADTPVLGAATITCQDGLIPVDLSSATDYGKTLGAIPVLGETLVGETVQSEGVILAIVGDYGATNPLPAGANPFPADLTNLGIPNGDLSLLNELANLIASALMLAP